MAQVDGSIKIDTKIDSASVDKNVQSINKSLMSLNNVAGMVATAFAGISIASFGKAALQSTAQIELAQVKLETLLGSATQAQTMIQDIIKMADVTPYNSEDLIAAATTLKTFGITADQIMPTLEALGNAAGGQADNLKGVAMALGQTAAQGKMMTQDLYQFINAGVPLLDLLAKRLKLSKQEIKSMIEEGKIGYKEVNGALQEFYTGNGKYAGLMARAAQTLPGMFSTMKDSMMSFGREVVSILEPALKSLIQNVTNIFTALSKWLKNMSPSMRENIAMIIKFIAVFGTLTAAIYVARTAMLLFNAAIMANPIMWLIGVIALAVAAFGRLTRAMSDAMLTTDQNEAMRKSVTALKDEYVSYDKTIQDMNDRNRAQKDMVQRVSAEFIRGAQSIKKMDSSTQEYSDQLTKLAADYQFLITYGSRNEQLTEKQKKAIERLKKELDDFNKTAKKTPAGGTPQIDSTALTKAELDKKQALWEQYYVWLDNETRGALAAQLLQEQFSYEKQIEDAKGDYTLLQALAREHEGKIDSIKKEWTKKHELAAFLMGLGMTEKTAEGMESGLHMVVSEVKHISETIAETFQVMGDIFKGSIDLLSWFADFSAKDLFGDFKKFIDGIANFFENELGSIPIWFDQGAKVLTDFLDGMIKNLPAIAETLGNVLEHIIDYFSKNSGKIISQILKIVQKLLLVILDKLPEIFKQLLIAFVDLIKGLVKIAPALIDAVMTAIAKMIQYIGENANELGKALTQLFLVAVEGLIRNMPQIVAALIAMTPYLMEFIAVTLPIELVKALPDMIKALVIATIGLIKEVPVALMKSCIDVGKDLIAGIVNGFVKAGDIWSKVKKVFTKFLDSIKSFFGIHSPSTVFYSLGIDMIKGLINGISSIGAKIWEIISSFFNFDWSDILSNIFDFGKNFISKIIEGVVSVGSSIWDTIKSFFVFDWTDIISEMFSAGEDLITALGKGISSMWKWLAALFDASGVADSITNVGSTLVDAITSGIKDPLNVFIDTVNDVISALNKIHVSLPKWLGGHSFGISLPYIPKLAKGTDYAQGGLTLVGENGPELVNMASGATVLNTSDSMRAIMQALTPQSASMAGSNVNISISISPADISLDGQTVGNAVFKRIDKIVRNAYGAY